MPLKRIESECAHDLYTCCVLFMMSCNGQAITCRVSHAALDFINGESAHSDDERLMSFTRHRNMIEAAASRQFDRGSLHPLVGSRDFRP
jgi:hypothetical protein